MSWNRVLDDSARTEFSAVIEEMRVLVPEMMSRKFERANVQQAFVFDAVQRLGRNGSNILAVGAHEDTAWSALVRKGWKIDAIDNSWGKSLDSLHRDLLGRPTYDIIFATSVIEHVEDDETFIHQMSELTNPGGYVILTSDFQPSWHPGDLTPPECYRMYTVESMHRIVGVMSNVSLIDDPTWHQGNCDFEYAGCRYAFATLVGCKIIQEIF